MNPRGIAKKALIHFCSETTAFSSIHRYQNRGKHVYSSFRTCSKAAAARVGLPPSTFCWPSFCLE